MTRCEAGAALRFQLTSDLAVTAPRRGVGRLLHRSSGAYVEVPLAVAGAVLEMAGPADFERLTFCEAASRVLAPDEAEYLFDVLYVTRIIGTSATEVDEPPTPSAELDWDVTGWATAKLLHESVVHTDFFPGTAEGARLQSRSSELLTTAGSGPPLVRPAPSDTVLELPPAGPLPRNDFREILLGRRTRRSFDPHSTVTLQQLSDILELAARRQRKLRNRWFGDHMLRTTPSGGARHPVEIYPQVLRADGFGPGNYHYSPVTHALSRIGDVSEDLIYAMGQLQPGVRDMPMAFIVTARFERNLWKYRYAKSYLFTWLDVGHFVQTLILCCEAAGLGCFLTPAIDVRLAQKHLQLPNVFDECAAYLVTAG